MFLHQKFNYVIKHLTTDEDIKQMRATFLEQVPKICVFDTETTGLNQITDIPFLFVFGFNKNIYTLDLLNNPIMDSAMGTIYTLMSMCQRTFAHNTKYDYHMMINARLPIPIRVNLADAQTIARLTNYADDDMRKSLEAMGTAYVDETAKFAGKVIKTRLSAITAQRKKVAQLHFNTELEIKNFGFYWELYHNRVQFVETPHDAILDVLSEIYYPPTYLDVYKENPALMLSYASDDCVILLEWLSKALPILIRVDPELKVFNRECQLIRIIGDMERIGFVADVGYLLESRKVLIEYRDRLYTQLHEVLGKPVTVYQHKVIKEIFAKKWRQHLDKSDNQHLKRVSGSPEAIKASRLIQELRTIDKWLSTYIDGMLNRITNGRIHTSIDNSGAVSGRVSSNLQQQPKEPLSDVDGNTLYRPDGTEMYHPRRAFVIDDDYELVFFDYSQQELRVQAYYTLLTSTGDPKLLRAYMPFQCVSILTGEPFDYKNHEVLCRWDSGEWVLEEDQGQFWEEVDVHSETTFTAFPFLERDKKHPEFKHYRKLGKVCNFLKNYQGGVGAIIEQLEVSEELAVTLDKAYYETFPMIRKFQQWVNRELQSKGYVENLFGRRYYMQNQKFFYRGGNYLVQGSSADMIKEVEIRIYEVLKHTRSSLLLPVHDEVIIAMHKSEMYLIPIIKSIMEDVPEVPWVPMVVEIERSSTNWADKEEVVL